MSGERELTLKHVSQQSGQAINRLRMWLRRFHFPPYKRKPNGYRVFTDLSIEAVNKVSFWIDDEDMSVEDAIHRWIALNKPIIDNSQGDSNIERVSLNEPTGIYSTYSSHNNYLLDQWFMIWKDIEHAWADKARKDVNARLYELHDKVIQSNSIDRTEYIIELNVHDYDHLSLALSILAHTYNKGILLTLVNSQHIQPKVFRYSSKELIGEGFTYLFSKNGLVRDIRNL